MGSDPRPRRFLPADPRVEEPYRLTPQLALRVAILGFVALAVFAVLFLRLWALQVLAGTKYSAQASQNRVRTIQVDAQRGNIVDSHGHPLVTSVIGTSLEVWPADLPKSRKVRMHELAQLSMVADIPVREILAKIKPHADDPLTPVVLRRGVHQDQQYYLKEHAIEFPGVQLADTYLRSYPYKSLLAQVLGYVGPITAAELKTAEKNRLSAAGRDGPGRDRADLRPLPARHRRNRPAHRRLARPADEPDPEPASSRSPGTRCS